MNVLGISRFTLKYAFRFCIPIRNLSLDTKRTQLETSKMSNLKMTHLKDISPETFNLFNKLIQTEEIQYLNQIFQNEGFEIRMAGGGVRDLLCHIVPHDIDFASDANPEQMINIMSGKPDIRLITTASGTKHGTVTARINNTSQYEITTLRIDKNTNGRHAEVEFVNDWKIDASRRDLTINSMFIDLNGVLFDYFGGESDLKNKIIRFVGDTEKRIQEDYLRIFRYFRFHSRFGLAENHDERTLSIMKDNLNGLEIISGERIWSEIKRILSNINCTNSIDVMFCKLNIGEHLGFISPNISMEEFYKVQQRLKLFSLQEKHISWKPQTLFSSLVNNIEELSSITARLKLSNSERDTISYILANRNANDPFNSHTLKTQLALAHRPNQNSLKQYVVQYLYYMGAPNSLIDEFINWQIPKFPFSGNMVMNRVNQKSQISLLLEQLKSIWAKNNFSMSDDEMKREVDRILEYLNKRSEM